MIHLLLSMYYDDIEYLELFEGPEDANVDKLRKEFDRLIKPPEKAKNQTMKDRREELREWKRHIKEMYPGKYNFDMFVSYLQKENGFKPVKWEQWNL